MSCKDLFLDIVDLSEDHLAMIEVGSCADPQLTSVQGTQVYDEDWLMHNFRFDKDYLEKDRYLYMFYSFNIFDSYDKDRPLKKQFKVDYFDLY